MKQRKKSFGMRISAFVLSFAMVCTLLAGVNVVAFAADDDLSDTVSVQKFYYDVNKGGNGEHIYTVDEDEISWYKSLPSWNDEGEAWKAPLFSEVPVYRVANYSTGEHLWITDKGYVDYLVGLGWTQEQGVAFYSDENMGVPVYRLWNGHDGVGSHHFTTDAGEVEWLVGQGWTAEDVAFYGVKEEEPQEFEITAMQTGTTEVTVTSDTMLSDDDDFTLMRGTTVVGVLADVDESGMSATLYTDETIIAADYTVVVTKADESTATDTFTGEASKLAGITFVGEQLILAPDNTFKNAYVAVRGVNQFLEPQILDNSFTFYPADGSTPTYNAESGVLTLSKTGSSVFVLGSQVPVTAVYTKNNQVLQTTATLTVSAAQAIQSFDFGEVDTTMSSLKGLPVTHRGLATGTYYVPVEAIDQYGNELSAAQLTMMKAAGSLIINPAAATGVQAFIDGFDTLDDGTVVATLANGDLTIPGTAVVSMVSVGGTSGMTSFEVADNRYIAELSVAIPTLYAGREAELDITAVDQFGIELDDDDLYELCKDGITATPATATEPATLTFGDRNALINQGSSITAAEKSGGQFKIVKNPAKKTIRIKYVPGAETEDTQALFTITSAKPTVNVQYATVKAAATPYGIKGLADSVNTVVRDDQNLSADLKSAGNVLFTDTYGNLCVGPQYLAEAPSTNQTAGFYYTVTPERTGGPKYTTFNATTGEVSPTAGTGAAIGADSYKITLYQVKDSKVNTLANKSVKITNSVGEFKSFTAVLVNGLGQIKTDLYVGNDNPPADFAALKVIGVDAGGNLVPISAGHYDYELRDDDVAGATLTDDYMSQGLIGVQTANWNDEIVTETAIVDVWNNDLDTEDSLLASVELECSNAPSTPIMFVGQVMSGSTVITTFDPSDGIEVAQGATLKYSNTGFSAQGMANGAIVYVQDNGTYGKGLTYVVAAVDQYGMVYTTKATMAGQAFATETLNAPAIVTAAAGQLSVAVPIAVTTTN